MIKRQCSSYFAVAFLSSFVILAVSTLAPSARKFPSIPSRGLSHVHTLVISVELMLIDGGVVAFPVGTIPANSVLKYV